MFEKLRQFVIAENKIRPDALHGPKHWRRVEKNGLMIARQTGADPVVVKLFALFHDAKRENDNQDPGHGRRAASYAESLRKNHFSITDAQFDLLLRACCGHTDGTLSEDPTIATCWDADRLDLGRVGITPASGFMSTEVGKRLAEIGDQDDPEDLFK